MPIEIVDNSAEFYRELDRRLNKLLVEVGDAVLEQGPRETPVKTGATLASEDKNVLPEEKAVEIGAATPYAPDIMTGANRSSGRPNPFLIRMLFDAMPKIHDAVERTGDSA